MSKIAAFWIARLREEGVTLWDRTLGVPRFRQDWSQHKTGDWDRGVAERKFEVHPQLGISLREKTGVCSMKPPLLTEPGAGQSISKLIRLIWSTKGLVPLMPRKSTKAMASAATDWPDLSYSNSALIRTRSIKKILTRMISPPSTPPLLRSRASWASSSATTVWLSLQRRLWMHCCKRILKLWGSWSLFNMLMRQWMDEKITLSGTFWKCVTGIKDLFKELGYSCTQCKCNAMWNCDCSSWHISFS